VNKDLEFKRGLVDWNQLSFELVVAGIAGVGILSFFAAVLINKFTCAYILFVDIDS